MIISHAYKSNNSRPAPIIRLHHGKRVSEKTLFIMFFKIMQFSTQ